MTILHGIFHKITRSWYTVIVTSNYLYRTTLSSYCIWWKSAFHVWYKIATKLTDVTKSHNTWQKLYLNKGGYLEQAVYSSKGPMCTRHKKMHCAFFIINNNSKNPDVKLIFPHRPADISQTEALLLCCGRGMLMVCRGRWEQGKFSRAGGVGVSTAMIHSAQE